MEQHFHCLFWQLLQELHFSPCSVLCLQLHLLSMTCSQLLPSSERPSSSVLPQTQSAEPQALLLVPCIVSGSATGSVQGSFAVFPVPQGTQGQQKLLWYSPDVGCDDSVWWRFWGSKCPRGRDPPGLRLAVSMIPNKCTTELSQNYVTLC